MYAMVSSLAQPDAGSGFRSLVEALEAAPAHRPFITSWIDEDEQDTLTFGEFRHRARIAASQLQRSGVVKGDRVVIIMPQGIAAMAAFAGTIMLNAVPAFLAYPNFKIEPEKYRTGLAGVTANLSAKAVLIGEAFPDDLLPYVNNAGRPLLRLGSECNDQVTNLPAPDPDSLAFIQHSAGTTGLQKGVALTHEAVLRHIVHLRSALRITERDRIYSWLPLYHDMGLIACFILPMVCHLQVVMQSPLDWVMQPESMLQVISEHRCTLAWLPNFAFQFVPRRVPVSRRAQYDLSSVRAFINCSEPVRAASFDEFATAFPSVKPRCLHSSYAMAENVFGVTQSYLASGPARLWADARAFRSDHRVSPVVPNAAGSLCFVSSGRLLPNNEVRVLSESGEILPENNVGEITIHSDTLFTGYYNRPDLTSAVLSDGWYRTGDLGFVSGGELYVVGRKKDLLIVGGENLYPQDIEETISAHPAIHDGRAVALGLYNPSLGTEDIVVIAEVEDKRLLADSTNLEQELREKVVAGTGVAVRTIILKPPKWIVKSTAGKPARAATRDKLLREHPELSADPQEIP